MWKWIARALSLSLMVEVTSNPSLAQNRSSTYTCEAFGRMSGLSLPRSLPCEDTYHNQYYKSYDLYCQAKAIQSDIRQLQGCDEKYFERQKALYGQ
jgi:hypothetical protein